MRAVALTQHEGHEPSNDCGMRRASSFAHRADALTSRYLLDVRVTVRDIFGVDRRDRQWTSSRPRTDATKKPLRRLSGWPALVRLPLRPTKSFIAEKVCVCVYVCVTARRCVWLTVAACHTQAHQTYTRTHTRAHLIPRTHTRTHPPAYSKLSLSFDGR